MTLTIVSRQAWGAQPQKPGTITQLAYPVSDVFLHHEGGGIVGADWSPEQEMAHMRELQDDAFRKGYSDFEYGAAVFPSGRAYEGRDLGFVCGGITAQEAATLGHNTGSVAIVFPGNYQTQAPTAIQLEVAAQVIQLAQYVGIVRLPATVEGHRDVYATACPGDHAYAALPSLRRLVTPPPAPVPAVKPAPPSPAVVKALKALAAFVRALTGKPLHYGDTGPLVARMNQLLTSHGYDCAGNVYGVASATAVHAFKVKRSMKSRDGKVCGRACALELLKK